MYKHWSVPALQIKKIYLFHFFSFTRLQNAGIFENAYDIRESGNFIRNYLEL